MKVRGLHVRIALMAGVFAAMLWGFQAMILHHAPDMFRAPQEDMSFGWYVPLFSLYVVWTERRKILESLGAPSWAGLFAALPFLALGFLGVRGVQLRFEIVAFVGLLITVPWAFFGKETAKAVLFPALFLLFCIPLATFLDVVTVHLRLLASSTAFAVARGVGADIVQQGTMVGAADGSFSIDVADPCSGLRSLFALMALTAGYAYFTQPTWLRRGILFAASVPIAILGNVMRILTIVLVANFASSDFATGFYHDYSGFVVFAVAILLMVATGEAVTRIFERKDVDSRQPASDSRQSGVDGRQSTAGLRISSSLPVAVLAFALVVPLMFFQAATPDVTVAEAPNVHLADIPGFSSEVLEPSEAELTVLPSDTVIEKRRYVADSGDWMVVSLVIGGKSKSSIHRPELCLPAQGLRMERPRTRSVAGRDWRFIDLASKDSPTFGFAYTFFNQEGFKTASHVSRIFRDVVDRSVLNRIDRWVMVTVNASRSDDVGLSYLLSRIELDGGDAK
ncbi:MAG: exosortase [Kiritimatiellae bacterium]|nr:exosortase [Kiritimatiellia bacterium]